MAETALRKSRDVNEIKKYRGAIKGQISSALSKLEALFSRKVADDFDHGSIFTPEVNQVEARLKDKLDLFRKLHDRCCELRDEGADTDQEIELANQDDEFSEEVTNKVYPMYGQIEAYYQSVSRFNLAKTIPALERKVEDSLAAFKLTMKNAQQIVQSLNSLNPEEICESAIVQMQPAEKTKDDLKKRYDEVVVSTSELKDALKARGDNEDTINQRIKFDRLEEMEKVENINVELEKIVTVQKLNSSKNVTSPHILSSTFRESAAASPIKLNKPDPLKFSGQCRDFASFKNKFESIVVPTDLQ